MVLVKSKYFNWLIIIIITLVTITTACEKDEEDYIPPTQPIFTENPDSTLGNLYCEIIYYHNGDYSVAPSRTKVRLYQSEYNLENDIATYKFETYGAENIIYFGYLNPGSYYVLAYTDIGLYDYEGVVSVMVIPNQTTNALLTMERIITETK